MTANDDQVIYSDDYTRLFTYQSRQFTAGDLSLKAINGVQWNAAVPAVVIAVSVTVATAAATAVAGSAAFHCTPLIAFNERSPAVNCRDW